jgi:hypothetical protein
MLSRWHFMMYPQRKCHFEVFSESASFTTSGNTHHGDLCTDPIQFWLYIVVDSLIKLGLLLNQLHPRPL